MISWKLCLNNSHDEYLNSIKYRQFQFIILMDEVTLDSCLLHGECLQFSKRPNTAVVLIVLSYGTADNCDRRPPFLRVKGSYLQSIVCICRAIPLLQGEILTTVTSSGVVFRQVSPIGSRIEKCPVLCIPHASLQSLYTTLSSTRMCSSKLSG
jgi:hypothetical protein